MAVNNKTEKNGVTFFLTVVENEESVKDKDRILELLEANFGKSEHTINIFNKKKPKAGTCAYAITIEP